MMMAFVSTFRFQVLDGNIYLLKTHCQISIVEGGGEGREVVLQVLVSVIGTAVSLGK